MGSGKWDVRVKMKWNAGSRGYKSGMWDIGVKKWDVGHGKAIKWDVWRGKCGMWGNSHKYRPPPHYVTEHSPETNCLSIPKYTYIQPENVA